MITGVGRDDGALGLRTMFDADQCRFAFPVAFWFFDLVREWTATSCPFEAPRCPIPRRDIEKHVSSAA